MHKITLRSISDIEGCTIGATDGIIGRVTDCYFDDEAWVIRYFIVETSGGMLRHKVLIPPMALGHPDWAEKILPVTITREQVKNSPDIDTDKPVSRQQELGYLGYYGYGIYWGGGGLWGAGVYPDILQAGLQDKRFRSKAAVATAAAQSDDPHLHSCNAVRRYYVHASDGEIGHICGFLADEKTWAIRYLIIDTSNWWLGHQVLVSPEWVEAVSWPESMVNVDLTRQSVKDAPAYDAKLPLDPEQQAVLDLHHRHHGKAPHAGSKQPTRPSRPAG
jgi:hypothetical protein